MMRQHGEKRTAGFTLLEVLVASAMASVLMLGLYHCFGTLVESGDRTESRLSALTAGRVFVDRMGVELRCAIKVQSGDEAPFVGDQNGLAFFTTASMVDPSVKAASALTHVAYKLDPGQGLAEGGGTVERTRQFFAGSKPISAIAGDRVLSGVEEWHVEYLGQGSGSPQWMDSWDRKGAIPEAVRIELSVRAGRRPRRSDVISLRSTFPVATAIETP